MHSLTFHETKQHGTPEFPIEYFYIDCDHPRYHMPVHWHKEWELIYVLQGIFPIYTDDVLHTAKAGDVLLIRDGMLHGGIPEDCVYECFLFDLHGLFRNLEMVKKYLRPIYRLLLLPQIHYDGGEYPEIAEIVSELMTVYRRQLHKAGSVPSEPGDCHELITISDIGRLFTTILQRGYYAPNRESSSGSSHRIDQVKSVLEYIEKHYASPITLEILAKEAGMNPRYFCRFFHSITHQTPLDYVNSYRIEQAAQMLHATDLPVTAISLECGFNDSSYFVKVFRKYRGLTPNQYRKQNH